MQRRRRRTSADASRPRRNRRPAMRRPGSLATCWRLRTTSTARELEAAFQRNGVTRIKSVGEALDPHKHQAMVELPSEDAEPGTIVEEMQPGYMMKDR